MDFDEQKKDQRQPNETRHDAERPAREAPGETRQEATPMEQNADNYRYTDWASI